MAKRSAITRANAADLHTHTLAPAPATHVSQLLVRVLVDVLRRRGIAPEALLGDAPEASRFEPDRRLPLAHYQALLARAIALSAEPALGLECGLTASESSFGLMSPLVSHATSLRNALELVSQFHGLMIEDVRIELSERMGTARLRCKPWTPLGRSIVELMVAGLVRTLNAFGCAGREIHAVCFEHARPPYHHAYAAAFGGAERFARSFTGIEFSASALDRLHVHRQPELAALLRGQAERSLERQARAPTCAERVRALMDSRRDPQAPDMALASRELGISVRSLRRRLLEEGTSYRELTQARLYESASAMLRNRDLTLQAIAHALGFADSSTFHRAFMRWAGVTPAQYRELPVGQAGLPVVVEQR